MRFRRLFLVLLFLIAVVGVAARQQDSHSRVGMARQDPNWTELIGSMDRMHAAMASTESSGNRDLDFVRFMMPHHQAALDMAKTELTYGKDPQVRRLAQEIITDQESEIQLMELWLKQHDANSHCENQNRGPMQMWSNNHEH